MGGPLDESHCLLSSIGKRDFLATCIVEEPTATFLDQSANDQSHFESVSAKT